MNACIDVYRRKHDFYNASYERFRLLLTTSYLTFSIALYVVVIGANVGPISVSICDIVQLIRTNLFYKDHMFLYGTVSFSATLSQVVFWKFMLRAYKSFFDNDLRLHNNNNIFILYSAKSMYSSKRFTIKRRDIASLQLIRNVKCAINILVKIMLHAINN